MERLTFYETIEATRLSIDKKDIHPGDKGPGYEGETARLCSYAREPSRGIRLVEVISLNFHNGKAVPAYLCTRVLSLVSVCIT